MGTFSTNLKCYDFTTSSQLGDSVDNTVEENTSQDGHKVRENNSEFSTATSLLFHRLHTHPFNSPLSRTRWVSQYQKGKTNLDFTEARDSEWQWHQLGHMQVCTSLQTDNHANTPPLSFLQARCPSRRPTNSVKALKGYGIKI